MSSGAVAVGGQRGTGCSGEVAIGDVESIMLMSDLNELLCFSGAETRPYVRVYVVWECCFVVFTTQSLCMGVQQLVSSRKRAHRPYCIEGGIGFSDGR